MKSLKLFFLILILTNCAGIKRADKELRCIEVPSFTQDRVEKSFEKIKNQCFGDKPDDFLVHVMKEHNEEFVNCLPGNSAQYCEVMLGLKYWKEKNEDKKQFDQTYDQKNSYSVDLKYIVSVVGEIKKLLIDGKEQAVNKHEVLNFINDDSMSFKVVTNDYVISFVHEGTFEKEVSESVRSVPIESLSITDIKRKETIIKPVKGTCKFSNPNIKNSIIQCNAMANDSKYVLDFVGIGYKEKIYERPIDSYKRMSLDSAKSCSKFHKNMNEFLYGSTTDYDLFEFFRNHCIEKSKQEVESKAKTSFYKILQNNCQTPYYNREGTMYISAKWNCLLDVDYIFYPKFGHGVSIDEQNFLKFNPGKWFQGLKISSNTGVRFEKISELGKERISFSSGNVKGNLIIKLSENLLSSYPLSVLVSGEEYRTIDLVENFSEVQIDFINSYFVFSWDASNTNKKHLVVDHEENRAMYISDTGKLKKILGVDSFYIINKSSSK